MPEALGEIYIAGPILDPLQAGTLGRSILALNSAQGNRFRNYALTIAPEPTLDTSLESNGTLCLNNEDYRLIDLCKQRFAQLLFRVYGFDSTILDDIILGVSANGRWHCDMEEGFRLLVSLSEDPIGLSVAPPEPVSGYTERMPYISYLDTHPNSQFESLITYGTGVGVLIDNTCPTLRQKPHAGSAEDDKIFIRLCAYPSYKYSSI